MSSKVSFSLEKAIYYAFKRPGLKQNAAILAVASVIFTGLALSKELIALSGLNVTVCVALNATLPIIASIAFRILVGCVAEKRYRYARNRKHSPGNFGHYKFAADKGHKKAPRRVASAYQDGIGVGQNNREALKYCTMALQFDPENKELKSQYGQLESLVPKVS